MPDPPSSTLNVAYMLKMYNIMSLEINNKKKKILSNVKNHIALKVTSENDVAVKYLYTENDSDQIEELGV